MNRKCEIVIKGRINVAIESRSPLFEMCPPPSLKTNWILTLFFKYYLIVSHTLISRLVAKRYVTGG